MSDFDFKEKTKEGIVALLQYLGENPSRDGLRDSPARFIKAFEEMTEGYRDNPKEILSTQFDMPFDEMIILRNIPFTSLCEHHFLPFIGTATIGYLPNAKGHKPKVVGLSKLARLLHCFARRLQIQERLTTEIADALQENLEPLGIGVIIKAHHLCMSTRGVKSPEAEMLTSIFRGALRENASARAEFLNLIREGI